jgi:hypothetical protein
MPNQPWKFLVTLLALTPLWVAVTGTQAEEPIQEEGINLECLWDGKAPSEWAMLELQLDHGKWLQDKRMGQQAILCQAELNGIDLSGLNFEDSIFSRAAMAGAVLTKASFKNADLRGANLQGTDLSNADFSGANLTGANLSNARLISTNLNDAIFSNVNLTGAIYQPLSTPSASYLGGLQGLGTLQFEGEPDASKSAGLVLLRAQLRKAGLQTLERQVTRTIERYENQTRSPAQRIIHAVFFDWTSGYGTDPSLCLRRLVSFIFLFSLFYMLPLSGIRIGGIYASAVSNPSNTTTRLRPKGLKVLGYGILFSLSSTVGFAGARLSLGRWISRIQQNERVFKARGLTRIASGVQTAICFYLLALWLLTLFARPFG